VRLAATWIVVGALVKLFAGSPVDLPRLVLELPLPGATLLSLVVGVELLVGLLGFLVPAAGWAAVVLILGLFEVVLGVQVARGETDCGCLAGVIDIPPVVMMGIDLALLVVALLGRPWRLPRPDRRVRPLAALAIVVAVALPLAFNRWAASGDAEAGAGSFVFLEFSKWVGQPVADTDFGRHYDTSGDPDGLWFFYRESCPVCAMCLEQMAATERGEREVVLFRMPEDPDAEEHVAVHTLPSGPFVHRRDLPALPKFVVTPPARAVVEGGRVVSGKEWMGPEDCR
jgi:hypothetical protein